MFHRFLQLSVFLTLALLAICAACRQLGVGCSRPAGISPASATAPADLMAGDWEGNWYNSSDSMSGRLTCQITPLGGAQYQAEFHATFAGFLPFDSTVTLTAQRQDALWKFHGQKDLGLLVGGLYTYDGHTDGHEFFSTYDSDDNKGTYRLRRPGATTVPSSQPTKDNQR